jgi:hypothetical protein
VTLKHDRVQHALTRTCRRIRTESLGLYYSLTRFNAHLDDGPATPLAAWLRVLGPDLTVLVNEINVWVRSRNHWRTNRRAYIYPPRETREKSQLDIHGY